MDTDTDACRRVVADNVRRLRLERGLSQEELSMRAGIDRTHLARFESQAINVSLNVLIAVAASLKIKPARLFKPVPVVREAATESKSPSLP